VITFRAPIQLADMAGYLSWYDEGRLRRKESRLIEKTSTMLTVFLVTTEKIFISGELDGVN
jgi:hypothetical protein